MNASSMGERSESWQLCLLEYQRAEHECIPRQKAFVFLLYDYIHIECIVWVLSRVSHITPFFELSLALLTTHAIGL